MTKTLTLAICLFPEVTALDYMGPMELFAFISPPTTASKFIPADMKPAVHFAPTYLYISKEHIPTQSGVRIVPEKTYEEVTEQFDIIMVPGSGVGTRPENCPPILDEFVRKQAPKAKYVLSVCTGAEVLARAGVLKGKKATTNKAAFRRIEGQTRDLGVTWVAKARWVVDGNVWTSSGVTAGTDMALAFLDHMVGDEIANFVRGNVELSLHKQDDDEFATFWGLVPKN
ncbi:hypothetical protein NM688_g7976 [Phlebia brevispora]|uniref:Uncharacterized protein n=1 Tax=Phlebia brevispora TaxID=194682 RepID=A0ACC1RZ75_9APHY|nr:hypothetical protein NM688_g7976 [Phlebia brevispora]